MSRILRRPMFRGGRVNSYGTGIATGLADGGLADIPRGGYDDGGKVCFPADSPAVKDLMGSMQPRSFAANGGRVGFRTGGSYLTLPDPVTNNPIGRTNATNTGITGISIADFFKPVTIGPTGFSDYRPGDRLRQAEREKFPMYDEFIKETETESDDDGTIRLASTDIEGIKLPTQKTTNEANVEAGLPISKIEETDAPGKKQQTMKTPKVNEPDDTEVTMTDLEKALGLDDAKREYASDALAAASKAFFEGRGFEAISDAAQVKSKAPEIKRLAAIEEFKMKGAKEIAATKAKNKTYAPGNAEKNYGFFVDQGIPKDEALNLSMKLARNFDAAFLELKKQGTVTAKDFDSLARSRNIDPLPQVDIETLEVGETYYVPGKKSLVTIILKEGKKDLIQTPY